MPSPPYVDVSFGAYLPDLGGRPAPGRSAYLVDAVNVRSTPSGYRGQPTFTAVSSAAVGAGNSTGTAAVFTTSGGSNQNWFAIADSVKIYQSADLGSTWTEVTPAGGFVTVISDIFAFDDQILVTSADGGAGGTIIEKRLSDLVSVDFSALAGSPPAARYGARVRDHVVLGAMLGVTPDEYTIRWGAIGDPEDWPTPGTADARSKEAGTQTLPLASGGIKRVIAGEKFGIVAQEFGLTRMTYVGGSAVYEFDAFDKRRGAGRGFASGPVPFVQIGPQLWAWINESGAYATDGYNVRPLSPGICEEALFLNSISHPSALSLAPIWGAYDQYRKQVIWSTNAGANTDQQLCYNTETGQFSFVTGSTYRYLFEGQEVGNVLKPRVFSFAADRKIYELDANAGTTVALQTGYIELDPGYRVQLQGAQLLGPGTSGLTIAYKAAATASACDVSQSGFTSMTAAPRGEMKTARATSKYFSFRITGTGVESQLIEGIRVFFRRAEPAQ